MTKLDVAIKALEEIRDNQGRVCESYETCGHTSCLSSYASWVIADKAIRSLQLMAESTVLDNHQKLQNNLILADNSDLL